MKFTMVPLLVAMVIAIANMPTDIYQICAWNHGTEKTEPWRAKLAKTDAVQRLVALATRVRDWCTDVGDGLSQFRLASEVGAVGNIKDLIQAEADTKAAIRKLKKEARDISAIAAEKRSPEQTARFEAIVFGKDGKPGELDALEAKLEGIEKDLVVARRLQDDERAAGAGLAASSIQTGVDHATERPWGPEIGAQASPIQRTEARHIALGNFAMAVRAAAYGNVDPRLQDLRATATGAGTQTDSNLGFAVPQEIAPGIEREMYTSGEILSRVDARSIAGNNMTYVVVNETSRADSSRGGGILGYWVDEGVAPTVSNTSLAKIELKLRKVGTLGVMTDELLSDAPALGGELEQGFADELIFQVENKVYRGNGASAPLGFLNAPCLVTVSKETNQAAATINTTNLSKMWARMPARSKKNSVWLVNTECGPQLDELSQAIGTGGTAPRFVNYDATGALTIKGRPVIEVEYAEALGTVGDIALVDLAKYRLIRKGGIEQASSMHVYFATGEQAFRAFYRVDGQAVPRAAITPFKGSATQSPFVVLQTR